METSPAIRVFTRLTVSPRGFLCGATAVLLLFALGCRRTPDGGKDGPAPEAGTRGDAAALARDLLGPDYPLPAGLITAWGDAGGECGWIHVQGFGAEFRPRTDRKKAETLAPVFPEWEVPGFRFPAWTDGSVGKLPQPEAPFGLSLMGASIGDTGMKDLGNLDRLQALSLCRTKITDAGLKELAGLKDLRLLDLGFTKTTDAGLRELAGLKELQALNLVDTGVADPGLKELAGLTQLQALCLNHTHVTDAGLKQLIGLEHLQWLSLDERPITDEGLKELAALRGLKILGLTDTRVTDAGLKELAGLEDLASLDLGYTEVSDAGLQQLAGLKRLRILLLMRTKVTGAGFKELADLKDLQSLILAYSPVTDAGLKDLARLPSLFTLTLGHTRVTDAGLKELAALQSLHNLGLWQTQITDAGLKDLAALENLQRLELNGTQVTDAGLKELAGCKNLRILDLSETLATQEGVAELRRVMPQVEIRFRPRLTEDDSDQDVAFGGKPVNKVEFRRAETAPAEGLVEALVVGSNQKVYLHPTVEISTADIAHASAGLSPKGVQEVLLRFSKEGAEKMAKLSGAHLGRPLAVLVNGRVVSAPVLNSVISENAAITSPDFSPEDVDRIVRSINGK